jgi:hypothetical protein
MARQDDAPRVTSYPRCVRGNRGECGRDFGNNLAKSNRWRQRVTDRCVYRASICERYRWCGGVINGEILPPAAMEEGEYRGTSPRTTRGTLLARQEALNAIR